MLCLGSCLTTSDIAPVGDSLRLGTIILLLLLLLILLDIAIERSSLGLFLSRESMNLNDLPVDFIGSHVGCLRPILNLVLGVPNNIKVASRSLHEILCRHQIRITFPSFVIRLAIKVSLSQRYLLVKLILNCLEMHRVDLEAIKESRKK